MADGTQLRFIPHYTVVVGEYRTRLGGRFSKLIRHTITRRHCTHRHTHVHAHVHTHTHTHTHTQVHAYMHVHTLTCTCPHTHTHKDTDQRERQLLAGHKWLFKSSLCYATHSTTDHHSLTPTHSLFLSSLNLVLAATHTHTHTHMHTCAHTHMHTYAHTHTHPPTLHNMHHNNTKLASHRCTRYKMEWIYQGWASELKH